VKSQRIAFGIRLSSILLVSGVIAAGWPAAANADPSSDSFNDMMAAIGLGDSGALSTALADAGRSMCPKLVKPGASLATSASQMQGNSGLTPQIAGIATGLAIQLECPALMAAIERGELPKMLKAAGKPAASPAPALPFALPGLGH